MNLPLFIAKRYLVSKKKQNIINIISLVSLAGIIVGTMAIIIVVSGLNGFTDLIGLFYSDFDPDLKVTPIEGKMFNPEKYDLEKINAIDGVASFTEVIEEMALLKYGKQQYPAIVKGVEPNYSDFIGIENRIIEGKFLLEEKGMPYAVVGRGVAYNLGLGLSFLDPIRIYVPKKGNQVSLNPSRSINIDHIFPSGIFAILEDIDARYILVSKSFATQLFESGNLVSAIEIDLHPNVSEKQVKQQLKSILGDGFHVKNKEEQHELVFKTMKSEKWVVYAILVFILVLASGNMIGNLTMLYIDKKDDIIILQSMGLPAKQVNRIFLYQGWLLTFTGALMGTILGILVCWLQIEFSLLKLPAGTFAISAYPIKIFFSDIALALVAVLIVGFAASWYPVKFMAPKTYLEGNIN